MGTKHQVSTFGSGCSERAPGHSGWVTETTATAKVRSLPASG